MFKFTLENVTKRLSAYSLRQITYVKQQNVNCNHIQCIRSFATQIPFPKPSSNNSKDEKYVLTRLQNDPDTFGPKPYEEELHNENDIKEEKYTLGEQPIGKKLSTKQYAEMIKALIRKKKIKEAIDIVETKMMKEDKVKPENYLYNLLLGACGRVGYTKKAFELYNEMKRRGLKIHPGAYTALFNACSNSPWPTTDGLTRTKHLHEIIIKSRYEPNLSNYHSMIKAYGRCGDLNSAFSLVDEMVSKGFAIKGETINMLLQACISDKEAGFRHALLVWRQLIKKHIKPSLYTYNLLLRAVRECGLGDLEVTKDLLKNILPENDKFLQLDSGSGPNISEDLLLSGKFEVESLQNDRLLLANQNRPDLLAETPHLGDIIELSEITKPEDRLLLLGGMQNILGHMAKDECKPDNKTFTQLLDCIPGTLSVENDLLKAITKSGVKPDLDFFNILIKKRAMRFDYKSAKDVLQMIEKEGYLPNLITYGVLSLGCRNKQEAESFLQEMNEAKYRINIEILGAMAKQACCQQDFPYVLFIMETTVKANISPSKKFMETLGDFYKVCKEISNDPNHHKSKSRSFAKGFQLFRMRFKTWKSQVEPEEEVHPWQQFRQPVETDVTHFKDKEAKSRFKAVHLSKFRQKQSKGEVVKNFISSKRKPKERWHYKKLDKS